MSDIIVVGAGPAGMTAALYTLRSGKSVTVIEAEAFGGQIATSPRVENFPSVKEISGAALADNMFEQITALGADVELDKITSIEKRGEGDFLVRGEYGEYTAKAVILALGVKHKHFGFPNEAELTGKGVYFCAVCDGAFYKDEEVALVGDGNSALQYGLLLSNYCSKVTIFTWFKQFFGDAALSKALLARKNAEWRPDTCISGFQGEGKLEAITVRGRENGESYTFPTKALFVAIGQVPDNGAFAALAPVDKYGYFVAGEDTATQTKGIFAAGDCRTKEVRQVTTAAADGATAALAAVKYIDSL